MTGAEPKSKVVATPDVSPKGKTFHEAKPLKVEERPAVLTLLEPIVNQPYSEELSMQNESADSACSFSFDVNKSDSSSETIGILQAQDSHDTNGITNGAAQIIIKSSKGNKKVVLKLQEEFLRLEKELELSSIDISLPEANKVVDDGEVVLQFISKETLKRCKKVKKSEDGSSNNAKKKTGLSGDVSIMEKGSNNNKEENIITVNGYSSNTEVYIETK